MPFVSVSSLSHLNGRCKMSSTCTANQEHPKWIQMQLLLECLTQVQSLSHHRLHISLWGN